MGKSVERRGVGSVEMDPQVPGQNRYGIIVSEGERQG
jgi:hypothetical protein